MNCICSKRCISQAGFLYPVFLALLVTISVTTMGAQPVRTTRPAPGFVRGFDATHEITVTGSIEEVVTKHEIGSPAGMHLLVTGPDGTVDAHLGAFLSKETKEALHKGLPIQVTGAVETLHGRQYLLARQIIYGGRTVTIRSKTGFLLGASGSRHVASSRVRNTKSVTGGAR